MGLRIKGCRKCLGCLWSDMRVPWFAPLQDVVHRANLMWVSRRILGNHPLLPSPIAVCGSSLQNSFLWFSGGGSNTARVLPKQETFTASWSAARPQGWQGHVSWFLLCGFHPVVQTQNLRSFFTSTLWWHKQAPEQAPFTWMLLLKNGGAVHGICSCFWLLVGLSDSAEGLLLLAVPSSFHFFFFGPQNSYTRKFFRTNDSVFWANRLQGKKSKWRKDLWICRLRYFRDTLISDL